LTCQATLASQSHGGIFVLEAESPAGRLDLERIDWQC